MPFTSQAHESNGGGWEGLEPDTNGTHGGGDAGSGGGGGTDIALRQENEQLRQRLEAVQDVGGNGTRRYWAWVAMTLCNT